MFFRFDRKTTTLLFGVFALCNESLWQPGDGLAPKRLTKKQAADSLVFLKPDSIDIEEVLKAPPGDDSAETRAELDTMLEIQKKRTAEECERASFSVKNSAASFFGPPYGPLSAKEAETLEPFFKEVRGDTNYFNQSAKKIWNRKRPFVNDSRLEPCVLKETTGSYPSGHSASARVFARVLVLLFPDRKDAIIKRSDQMASDRVMAGLHHPSDVEAGKELGDAVFEKMKQTATFKKELKKYKDAL